MEPNYLALLADTDDDQILDQIACEDLEAEAEAVQENEDFEILYRRLKPARKDMQEEAEKTRDHMRAMLGLGKLTEAVCDLHHMQWILFDQKNYDRCAEDRLFLQCCVSMRERLQPGDFHYIQGVMGLDPLSADLSGVDEGWLECWKQIALEVSHA